MVDTRETVLITGVTGYIGSHLGLQMLQGYADRFRVRASVRSLANKAKLDPLLKAYGENLFNQIEFVEADLLDRAKLRKAV